jgi:hypothetical protein
MRRSLSRLSGLTRSLPTSRFNATKINTSSVRAMATTADDEDFDVELPELKSGSANPWAVFDS